MNVNLYDVKVGLKSRLNNMFVDVTSVQQTDM